MTSDYQEIKTENIRRYGEDTWYQDILSNMYSDKTHFIFELIQNAEDANASEIKFFFYSDKIEIIHDGKKLFDENDVKGICGLAKGTKKDDFTKIGKFGLGFKSVYAYTDTPLIYSGDESFKIEMFVRPSKIDPLNDLDKHLTKIVLPFKPKIDKVKASNEIIEKITNMDLKTILFLKKIKSIKWFIENKNSGYYKKEERDNEQFNIFKITTNNQEKTENWLLFNKPIGVNDLKVELAFRIDYKEKDGDFSIIPTDKTELVVFFPTKKETHLKFLIQGPFRTTHNRENIPFEDEWNQKLLTKTSELIQETLLKFKEDKLLDVNTLQLFPIDKEIFTEKNAFYPLYHAVKEKILSGEDILPTFDKGYISYHNALIARTKELRELLNTEHISELFKKDNAMWLDSNITIDKMPLLRKYLMEEIGLQEITPERFANAFSKSFIQDQTDGWVIKFYKFLLNQPAIWREKKSWESEGILRKKPFIRLNDGNHIHPFDENGKPIVFLPSGNPYDSMFKIVKENIANDLTGKEFLIKLGIKEPNMVAGTRQFILPKYKSQQITVTKEQNLLDVEYIRKTISSDKSVEVQELIKEMKNIPFLYAINLSINKTFWSPPIKTYLGKKYTDSEDLDIYFEGNEDVLFLDNCYSPMIKLEDLKKIGCNDRIIVKYRTPSNWNNHITIKSFSYGPYERGLDGFDPDCEITELEFALKNINLDKARIIWKYLKKYSKSIKGIIEKATNQNYYDGDKEEEISKMGKLIIDSEWLPNESNHFYRPSELFLSDLPDSFDKESLESLNIAKKIMKKEIEQKILDSFPDKEKEKMEKLLSLSKRCTIEQIEKIEKLMNKSDENKYEKEKESSYKKALSDNTSPKESQVDDSDDEITYPSITADNRSGEEKKELDDEDIKDAKSDLEQKEKEINLKKDRESYKIQPEIRSKLIQEYDGRCQICFKKIKDNDKKLHLKFKRLVQPHQSDYGISDESNVLALCPNHWIEISRNYPWSFINNDKVSDEPDFKNVENINKFEKDFIGIKIMIKSKKHIIHYNETHFRKFKHLYENY